MAELEKSMHPALPERAFLTTVTKIKRIPEGRREGRKGEQTYNINKLNACYNKTQFAHKIHSMV